MMMVVMIMTIIIISGQSNLTKSRIAAADERFNRIWQMAPICSPMAFAPYRFCTLLSIDRGHVRALTVCHLSFLNKIIFHRVFST